MEISRLWKKTNYNFQSRWPIYSVNIWSIFEIDCEIYSVFCFYHIWNVLHMSKCTDRRCQDVRTSRSRLSWTDTDRQEHDWHQNLLAIKANIFGHFENSLVVCFCHICEEPHMSKCTDEMTEGRTNYSLPPLIILAVRSGLWERMVCRST